MRPKTFIIGLIATFGLPWLALLAVPAYRISQEPTPKFVEALDGGLSGTYVPKRTGAMATGFQIYQGQGCAVCHSQWIRNTDVGSDMWRPDWAGHITAKGDTRRETRHWDFGGETIAPVGIMRIGQDLSNISVRVLDRIGGEDIPGSTELARKWFYLHLYNPRDSQFGESSLTSKCDAHPEMFTIRKVTTKQSAEALPLMTETGQEIVPTQQARQLVDYLMSLRRDDKVPQTGSYKPAPEAEAKPAK